MEKQVVFYIYTSGKQEVFGKVLFKDGEISFENLSPSFIKELKNGIQDNRDMTMVDPSSGIKFLEALPYYYKGSMFVASLVQEIEE